MTVPTPRSAAPRAAKPAATKATPAQAAETVSPPQAAAASATPPGPPAPPSTPSVLERLRRNQMGAVVGGLVVALALGLLLSLIVPDSQLLLALAIFGMAVAVAVGFTVRYLTEVRGLTTQLTAFVTAAIGVHVLGTTGVAYQKIGDLGDLLGGLGGSDAGSDLGFDDALLVGLWTPTVSTGAIVAGLVAAIIAGWGPRLVSRLDEAPVAR